MKIVLISVRYINNKPILSWDYTHLLQYFDNHFSNTLTIHLPTGTIKLPKYEYLNKLKVYENPKDAKCYFVVFAYKKFNVDFCLDFLKKYADSRVKKLRRVKRIAA